MLSTVHNWVQKGGIQPDTGRTPDHVAAGETVIHVDGECVWLSAAVDPARNEFLHLDTSLSKRAGHASVLPGLRRRHDVEDGTVLADGSWTLREPSVDWGSDSGANATGITTAANLSSERCDADRTLRKRCPQRRWRDGVADVGRHRERRV